MSHGRIASLQGSLREGLQCAPKLLFNWEREVRFTALKRPPQSPVPARTAHYRRRLGPLQLPASLNPLAPAARLTPRRGNRR
jgi:hypothetical protein